MTVIGTASRPESQQWVREAGAHHVIDHSKPLADELARIGITSVTHVASLTNTEQHFNALIDALAPQGKLALIDDPETLDVVPLKAKSLSLHWEFMFTRSMFETDDMIAQHQLLTRVAVINKVKNSMKIGVYHRILHPCRGRRWGTPRRKQSCAVCSAFIHHGCAAGSQGSSGCRPNGRFPL